MFRRDRQLPSADRRHLLIYSQSCEPQKLAVGQSSDQQMDVAHPEKPLLVAVMHHRMNTREQQRVRCRIGARVRSQGRYRHSFSAEFRVGQHVGKERLRADLPVHVEHVFDAERVNLRELELTEHMLAAGHRRLAITKARHGVTRDLDLIAGDQEVSIDGWPHRRGVIDRSGKRCAFEQDRKDSVCRECVEDTRDFTRTHQFDGRRRAHPLLEREAYRIRPIARLCASGQLEVDEC